MYLHKENRTILNISLDDSNGLTQMDSVAAYKLVDNYMKNTGLMYEIYHHTCPSEAVRLSCLSQH
jgi:hypothetical protein